MTGSAGFPGAADLIASASQQKSRAPSTKPLLKAMVAVLMAGSSASAVQAANCGAAALGGGSGGPPSISATEASTTQVLEEIRRRTQVAQQQMQPTPVSDTTVAPAATGGGGGSAASGGAAKPAGQAAQGAPAGTSKPTYKKVAMAAPTDTSEYSYDGGTHKVTSSWGQAYLDYEFHDNIAPGSQENRARNSRTAGALSGTDWTWIKSGGAPQAFQFGLFSGYQAQFNKFSNTNFDAPQTTNNTGTDNFNRTENNQDIQGSFYGAYVAVIRGNETYDLAFKADDFDLHQNSLLTQTNGTCGPGNIPDAIEAGKASVNNYTISGDASYRHHINEASWVEPTIGLRYTWTDYGNDATQLVSNGGSNSTILQQASSGRLGLADGTVFRLTAGVRMGHEEVLPGGTLWTIWGGAYAYSDLLITGFKFSAPTVVDGGGNVVSAGTTVFPVDEGKVRGLGQIVSTWDYNNHWSYLMAGEIRGGTDLFGVGGRIGARYRW